MPLLTTAMRSRWCSQGPALNAFHLTPSCSKLVFRKQCSELTAYRFFDLLKLLEHFVMLTILDRFAATNLPHREEGGLGKTNVILAGGITRFTVLPLGSFMTDTRILGFMTPFPQCAQKHSMYHYVCYLRNPPYLLSFRGNPVQFLLSADART